MDPHSLYTKLRTENSRGVQDVNTTGVEMGLDVSNQPGGDHDGEVSGQNEVASRE
jgi:hypothetical protein